MAQMGNLIMKIKIDDFFTQTRLRGCASTNCMHNMAKSKEKDAGDYCGLKNIEIGENGQCLRNTGGHPLSKPIKFGTDASDSKEK